MLNAYKHNGVTDTAKIEKLEENILDCAHKASRIKKNWIKFKFVITKDFNLIFNKRFLIFIQYKFNSFIWLYLKIIFRLIAYILSLIYIYIYNVVEIMFLLKFWTKYILDLV